MQRPLMTSGRVLACLVLLLIVLSVLRARTIRWATDLPRDLVGAMLLPVERPLTWVGRRLRPARPQPADVGDVQTLGQRYREAQAYNRHLWLTLQEARRKIARLEGLQAAMPVLGHTELAASVIGATVNRDNPTITINRGWRNQVRGGCAVVDRFNFVGVVSNTTPRTATVRMITAAQTQVQVLITPPSAGAPPRRLETRLHWDRNMAAFTAIVGRDKPVEVEDLAHLADQAFPAGAYGFIIGVVRKIEDYERNPLLHQRLVVEPDPNLQRLQNVVVLIPVES